MSPGRRPPRIAQNGGRRLRCRGAGALRTVDNEYVSNSSLPSELTEVIEAIAECRLDQDMPLRLCHLKKSRFVPAVHTLVLVAECTDHGTIRATHDERTEASLVVTSLTNWVSSVLGVH